MALHPDFGLTARDYASHRAGFPDSLFERLEPFGVGRRCSRSTKTSGKYSAPLRG